MAGETAGRKGNLYLAATSSGTLTKVARVRNWEINGNESLADITNNDSSGYGEYLPVKRDHALTIEALYLSTDNAQQESALSAFASQTSRYFSLRPTTSATPAWVGTGFVQTFRVGGEAEDADILNLTVQYSGAVTYST